MDFACIQIHLFEMYPLTQMGNTKDFRFSRWAQSISGADKTLVRQRVAVNVHNCSSFQGSLTCARVLIRPCVFNFGLENLVLLPTRLSLGL